MELTLDAVAKDAFRRDYLYRCFSQQEAQALELRFAFLHRIRQYKRLVGRRDVLPRAGKDIVASYLQQVESTNQLLLPPLAEPLRTRVINAVDGGYCPLDLFNGMETLVREHMTRDVFPIFLRSQEYTELCDALRSRLQLPLAQVLVDSRRTQFLMRFLSQEFPGEEGNLLFWVHVQTKFLPLIQTTVFSVALFEEMQRHVRHVFNRFLVGETELREEKAESAATRVPEPVRRDTLQQIMKLQSEPFSPSRYASLFRAAQDCVWEWLQTDVYPKFYASSLYVMLVVETEDLETDQQLRRLSEHLQASVMDSGAVHLENQVQRISWKSEAQLKANAVFVPIKTFTIETLWNQGAECNRCLYDRVLAVQELAQYGIYSLSVASMVSLGTSFAGQAVFELYCTGNQQEAAVNYHPAHLNYWRKNMTGTAFDSVLSPSGRTIKLAVPKPSFHDFVLPLDGSATSRYLFGVCLTLWRQKPIQEETNTLIVNEIASTSIDPAVGGPVATAQFYPQFCTILTIEPMLKKSRRLLLQLASSNMKDDLTADTISTLVVTTFESASSARQFLRPAYSGFYLQPNIREGDMSLSSVFKEISPQTVISTFASILVGRSIILVSDRSTALVSVSEAIRELLKPFEWTHLYLPFCPVSTCVELRDVGFFSKSNNCSFLFGFEGVLSSSKKIIGTDQRYQIQNSFYTTHKVSLSLQTPPMAGSSEYPPELFQTTAIVIDIDSDDIYVSESVEIPELPHSIVRSLESTLNCALHSSCITQADSYFFNPGKSSSFFEAMLVKANQSEEPRAEIARNALEMSILSLDDKVRLAFLWFLDALFGDVVYYFCSLHQNFAVEAKSISTDIDQYLLFEIDSFLDAHTELGCRDFFRQCFHTELFRKFLLDQHMQFAFTSVTSDLGPIEASLESHLEPHQLVQPDAFI